MNRGDTKRTGLVAFTQQVCANYCSYYDICVNSNQKCLIQQEKSCEYFESILLPIAQQQGIYKKIVRQYKKISDSFETDDIRRCPDCGAELQYRKKLCKNCRKKRRQKTKRENQRKYRKNNRV